MIISKIQREQGEYHDIVKVVDGYDHCMPATLKKIDLYYASKFMGGQYDSEKFKRIFMNIVKNRVNTATKAIDLDTKDIRVIAEDGQSYFPAWFFERELKQFMKEEHFGELLNKISTALPRYGTVVIKNIDGKPMFVPLKNLRVDPSVADIENSSWVHEEHTYTLDEFKDIGTKKQWNHVDEIIDAHRDAGLMEVVAVERYGFVDQDDVEDLKIKGGEIKKAMTLVVAVERDGQDPYRDDSKKKHIGQWIVTEMEVDEWPYRDLHWEKEDGRYLGVGVVEDLFQDQEYYNDVNHMERKALYWYSKVLFKSNDQNVPSNLFQQMKNGDVIELKNNGDINLLPMQERNLPQYNALYERVEANADKRAFTFEVNTGEALPSGTPFRLGAILSNAVASHYAYKRENNGMFVKELITDFIVPALKRHTRKGHVLNFEGDRNEIEKYDELVVNEMLRKEIDKIEKQTGKLPSPLRFEQEREALFAKLAQRENRFLELPDKFYDDLKFRVDIVITGESKNIVSEIETLSNLYQAVAPTNPQAANEVLQQIMNLTGISPNEIDMSQQQVAPAEMDQQANPQLLEQNNLQV